MLLQWHHGMKQASMSSKSVSASTAATAHAAFLRNLALQRQCHDKESQLLLQTKAVGVMADNV